MDKIMNEYKNLFILKKYNELENKMREDSLKYKANVFLEKNNRVILFI